MLTYRISTKLIWKRETMTLMTPEAVAEAVGVSAQTIRRWIDAGKVAAYRLPSGQYRIEESEIANMLTPVVPTSAPSPE